MDTWDRKKLKKLEAEKSQKKGVQLAYVHHQLGDVYFQNELNKEAIGEYIEALHLYETSGNQHESGSVCRSIGECFCNLSDYDSAINYHKKFLHLAKGSANKTQEQRAWATLGRTYLSKVDSLKDSATRYNALKLSEQHFLKCLDVAKLLEDSISETERAQMFARAYLNLGIVSDILTNYDVSLKHLEQAVHMSRGYPEMLEDLHTAQITLAEVLRKAHRYRDSIKVLDSAYNVAVKLKNKTSQRDILLLKAYTFVLNEDLTEARKSLKLARRIDETDISVCGLIVKYYKAVAQLDICTSHIDKQELQEAYEKLGDLDASEGRYDIAVEHYLRVIDIGLKENQNLTQMASIYESIAVTYEDLMIYDKSAKYYRKLVSVHDGNYRKMCKALVSLANVQTLDTRSCAYNEVSETLRSAYTSATAGKLNYFKMKVLESLATLQETYKMEDERKLTLSKLNSLRAKYPDISLDVEEEDTQEMNESTCSSNYDLEMSDLSESDGERSSKGFIQKTHHNFTKTNEKGETILQQACIKGHKKKVKELIEMGAPVNVRDNSGWTPLHEACNYGFLDIVELLVANGGDINDRGGSECDGVTPLHDAASLGNTHIVEFLIDNGADVIAKDDHGKTPLDSLRLWKNENMADVNETDLADCERIERKLSNRMLRVGFKPFKNDTFRTKRSSDVKQNDWISLRQKSWQNQNNSDDLEFECLPLDRRKTKASSATKEYQSVMKNCRTSALTEKQTTKRPTPLLSKSAFVTEDVGDDWLIDDLNQQPTKRKLSATATFTSGSSMRTNIKRQKMPEKETFRNKLKVKTRKHVVDDDDDDNDVSIESPKDFDVSAFERSCNYYMTDDIGNIDVASSPVRAEKIKNSSRITDLITSSSSSSFTTAKPRLSVIDLPKSEMRSNHIYLNSYETSSINHCNSAFDKKLGNQQACQMVSKVKVKVNDKLLLVPVSHNQSTVSWLIKEATHRYFAIYHITPVIQNLCTSDGAVLSPDDVITAILAYGEQVEAAIEKWEVPELSERYRQACLTHNTVFYKNISDLLNKSANGSLDLSTLGLRSPQLFPVFRSLVQETSLTELRLKGNKLRDKGLNELCQLLPSLIRLTVLDIGLNQITVEGLTCFSEMFTIAVHDGSRVLQNLSQLSLDHNFLDGCSELLCNIVRSLHSLTYLDLSSCFLCNRTLTELENTLNESDIKEVNLRYNLINDNCSTVKTLREKITVSLTMVDTNEDTRRLKQI